MLHRQIPSAAPAACGARLSFVSGAASLPPPSWRGDEGGVVGDEAEQRRAAGVLPGEAEEVEPRHLGDAAAVAQSARRRPSPAARSTSGPAGSRTPRPLRRPPARCRRRSRSCGRRRGRRAAAPGRRAASPASGSSRSGCRDPVGVGRGATRPSSRASRAWSATRRRRGRAAAAAAASAGSRPRDAPRGSRRAPSRSENRCCRRRPRARGPRGHPPAGGTRCCASGRPPRRGLRRGRARSAPGTGPWPRQPDLARIRFSSVSSTNASLSLLSERTGLESAIGSWKCSAYRSRYAMTSSRVGYPSGSPGKASPGSAS